MNDTIKGTRVTSHEDVPAGAKGYANDTLYLGITPAESCKVYLTVQEIVAYGIVLRPRSQPKATVQEVVECINRLALDHHAVRDGQLVYDPVPIREALSTGTRLR